MAAESNTYKQLNWLVDRTLDPYARTAMQQMLQILQDKEPVTMADIQQALADLDAAISGVKQRTQDDYDNLRSEFDAFKASNPGTDTAALDAAVSQIESSVTQLNAIDLTPAQASVPDSPAPAPTPEPTPDSPPPAPVEVPTPDAGTPDAGGTEAPVDQPSTDVPAPTPDVPADAPVDPTPAPADPTPAADAPVSDGTA